MWGPLAWDAGTTGKDVGTPAGMRGPPAQDAGTSGRDGGDTQHGTWGPPAGPTGTG